MKLIDKESMVRILNELSSMAASFVDTNYKLDGLDKNVVNRLSELLVELQKQTALNIFGFLSV